MRVLQLGPLCNNHLRRWSEHARELGHTVVAAGHVRPGRLPVDLSGLAEQVELAPKGLYGADDVLHLEWLSWVLRRLRPDLIHGHWLPKWPYYAALLGQSPLVVTGWGSDVYEPTPLERDRGDLVLQHADRIIARSQHMRRALLARGASAERMDLADLGVDLERFRPATSAERTRLRRELGLPEGPLVLSFRGTDDLYQLDVVLEAFRIARMRLPDATLVLVHGDAPLGPRLAGLVARTRAVHRVGYVPHSDMARYFRAATVGVSVPWTDGSPSSVWEALACGLPLVLSDLPQIAEKVGESGAAILVEPTAGAVADAIADAVASAGHVAPAARSWALSHADERDQVPRLAGVYAAAVRQPAAAGRRRRPRLVSVVLPVRDQARYLREQIACLGAQDYEGDWELVVADNGSSDGSAQVAREAGRELPAVRVVDASDRPGASHARNVGAAAARGDLIAFCDADNAARPGWLRALCSAAEEADLVTGRFMVNALNDSDRAAWVGPAPCVHEPLRALGFLAFASGGNSAFWSDVFTEVGGFDEELVAGEDIDLSWRAQLRGYRLGFARDAPMDRRCPPDLAKLVRQHWRYGRGAGRLVLRYRRAGVEHGFRREIAAQWHVAQLLPRLVRTRGGRGYWLGQVALATGRSVELLKGRGDGSGPSRPAFQPSSPS